MLKDFGDAKVSNLDNLVPATPVAVKENVPGLEVSVKDPVCMHVL